MSKITNRFMAQLPGGNSLEGKNEDYDPHGFIPNPGIGLNLQYPRMLYKGAWKDQEQLVVQDESAEAAAVEIGWTNTVPQPPWFKPPATSSPKQNLKVG